MKMDKDEKEYRRLLRRRKYDSYWKLNDLVFFTGLKEEEILKKVAQGTIPFRKKWNILFFDPDEIKTWLRDGLYRISYPSREPRLPMVRAVKTRITD